MSTATLTPEASAPAETAGDDRCWVTIETPLSLPALRAFCADVERLYRVNPWLEIRAWEPLPAGRVRASWRNLASGIADTIELACERESSDVFSLVFSHGIKRRTRFALEAAGPGSRLTITDDYTALAEAERARRLAEVDPTLPAWGRALRAHFRREHRWGGNPLWRWTMRRLWLPMTPSARRITRLVLLITAAELVLIVFVALIYRIERGG